MTPTENKAIVAFTWSGEEVLLTPFHKFHVESLDKDYATAQEAKDAIDRKHAALAKVKRPKLALKLIAEDGVEYVLTGLHAGNFNPLLTPKCNRYSTPALYPLCDHARNTLATILRLRKEANELKEALEVNALDKSVFSHYNFNGDLADRYAKVEADYAAKLKKMEGK